MKFSIIMASYNQVDFIEQAIQSVLNQTYQNFELIIVDGLSSDGSQDIINQYKDHSNVKVVIEEDNGLYHARNKGILLASGDVVSFLNTDDYYEAIALEHIYMCFNKNKDVDVFYGVVHAVSKEGNFIRKYGNYEFNKEKLIRKYIAIPDQTTFIRAKYIPYLGLFDTSYKIVADWDLWQRALVLGLKFLYTNIHIANYRHYDETLTFSPKLVNLRFKEVKRLYRKYNDVCISSFIVKIYYWHYVKRPLKNITFIESIYRRVKS